MKDLFIDIEALGLRPGCAIIELGAVFFDPATGETGPEFSQRIVPSAPFTADIDTLAWHGRQGTWPRVDQSGDVHPKSALDNFRRWLDYGHGYEATTLWSWGSTYDFPILGAAFELTGVECPWEYWQVMDARTVWKLAFPSVKHAPRPHLALDDCLAGVADLCAGLAKLAGKEVAP